MPNRLQGPSSCTGRLLDCDRPYGRRPPLARMLWRRLRRPNHRSRARPRGSRTRADASVRCTSLHARTPQRRRARPRVDGHLVLRSRKSAGGAEQSVVQPMSSRRSTSGNVRSERSGVIYQPSLHPHSQSSVTWQVASRICSSHRSASGTARASDTAATSPLFTADGHTAAVTAAALGLLIGFAPQLVLSIVVGG